MRPVSVFWVAMVMVLLPLLPHTAAIELGECYNHPDLEGVANMKALAGGDDGTSDDEGSECGILVSVIRF